MVLRNEEIDFLFDLEIKIQHQAYLLKEGLTPTADDLINYKDFETYYNIMEKIQSDKIQNRARANDYKKLPINRKRANIIQNINNAKRRNDKAKIDYWTKKLEEYKKEVE
jgi:hypothetical protein